MENASIITFIEYKLRDLYVLWDEIGLNDDERYENVQKLSKDIKDTFDNMIIKESSIRDKIRDDIEKKMENLNEILTQIGVNTVSVNNYDNIISLNDRLKKIEDDLVHYNKIKDEKIKLFTETIESTIEISKSIDENERTIAFMNGFSSDKNQNIKINDFYFSNLKDETLTKILEHKNELLIEKEKRIKEFDSLNKEIESLCYVLGEDVSYFKYNCIHSCDCDDITREYVNHNVILNDSVKELSNYSLETLRNFVKLLISIRYYRTNLIESYRLKIEKIAKKLNEDKLDINNLTDDITIKSLNMYRSVIHNLEEKKNIYIKNLIDQSFDKIKCYWEDLYVDIETRQQFILKYMNQYNDEVLDELDKEVERLENLSIKSEPIKKLIKERLSLLEMKEKLDNPDPKRLLDNNKNSTFLLEEEKMRKRIKIELPSITKKLIKLLKIWEKENEGLQFIYEGEIYLNKIMKEIEEDKKKKDDIKIKKEIERSKRLGFTQQLNGENNNNNQNIYTPLKTPIKKSLIKTPSTKTRSSSITPMKNIERTPLKLSSSTRKGNSSLILSSSQQNKTPMMKRKISDQNSSKRQKA